MVLVAWLVLGLVWGALHWLIVPRIGEFRPTLEEYATRVLGVPVRMGSVTAQSNGMVPSVELTDVVLLDTQGRVALSLPRVLVALSPRSMWRMGFEQLYIDRPKLDIRRAVDGKITIAGLDFASANQVESGALDWFFSQFEFAIHDGVVRWTDEQRTTEPIELANVEVVVRNRGRHHDLRLDATPPPQWGGSFSLRGKFLQPLLSRQKGQWQDWEGQLYAAFERADLSALHRYVPLGVELAQGTGALRAWLDLSRGQITNAVADVALAEVKLILGADLQALALQSVQGRLGGRLLAQGFEFFTQSLVFDTRDGLHWPGGNISVTHIPEQAKELARGELKADRLDLAALAQIASHLPLHATARDWLMAYAPKGKVEKLQASWRGPLAAPEKYAVKGRVSQFESSPVAAVPGLRGLNADFDFDQNSGKAGLSMTGGSVTVPDIFQEPVIAVDDLVAEAHWQVQGERVVLQLDKVRFANADAQGDAQIKWETSDPSKSSSGSRFPGVLDLQANLSRADGKQVYRYLPLVIDKAARDYVHDAVQGGRATAVHFQVKGEINQLPLMDIRQGAFRISAQVHDAKLAYVPRSLQAKADLPWPVLTELSGELVIDRMQLQVKNAHGKLGESSGIQVTNVEALIADLNNTRVSVNADFKGPTNEMLRLVNASPLRSMTAHALANTVLAGNAEYKLKLLLPVAEINKSTVRGSVVLVGNDVQISPDSPKLTRARGVVNFTEAGFSLSSVQARMFGGDARLDGGLLFLPDSPSGQGAPTMIRASGTASAEGLRQASELGFVARLARQASGSASYIATLGLRRGVLELMVSSNLQGVALNLPAPLIKSADALLPFRLETALLTNGATQLQDRLTLSIANLAQIVYERDVSQAEPRVLRGAIGVGLDAQESAPLPVLGVSANINLKNFDVDAWSDALTQITGKPMSGAAPTSGHSLALSYLPSVVALRSDALIFGGRQFNHVVIGGAREDLLWRANLDASELNGYLEYRQPTDGSGGAGRVYARLARLTIAPSAASDVEALLDSQPASIPALDIVVDDFELRGKRLGRLEVEAINRRGGASEREGGLREWRLNKFNVLMPEATLTASGNWASMRASSLGATGAAQRSVAENRRTAMSFKLDINDSGALLNRLGMQDVVRSGRGKIEGQVGWMGSPLSLDYPSMGGAFTVNVESGQFLKADPGIAKLLGVLSLQSLPRRLALDFRDVFSEGFAFDFVRGDISIDKGMALTNNLQMKGVNAAVMMEGRADIAQETQSIKVVVIPEINAGTASLIASVINPAVGLGTFLAQVFLRRPLIESATQEFHIDGSWADPKITKVTHSATTPPETP